MVRRRVMTVLFSFGFSPGAAMIGARANAHDPPLAGSPIPHSATKASRPYRCRSGKFLALRSSARRGQRACGEAGLAAAARPLRLPPRPAGVADKRTRGDKSNEAPNHRRRGAHATLLPSGGPHPGRWSTSADYASGPDGRKEKRAAAGPPFLRARRLGRALYHFQPPPKPEARTRLPNTTSWMPRVRRRVIFAASPLDFRLAPR